MPDSNRLEKCEMTSSASQTSAVRQLQRSSHRGCPEFSLLPLRNATVAAIKPSSGSNSHSLVRTAGVTKIETIFLLWIERLRSLNALLRLIFSSVNTLKGLPKPRGTS